MTSGWLLAGTRWSTSFHSWFSGNSTADEMLPQPRFNTPPPMFPISSGAEHHRTCKFPPFHKQVFPCAVDFVVGRGL